MRLYTLALILPLFAAGCNNPLLSGSEAHADIALLADHTVYAQGDTANIVLRNDSRVAVGYNLCHSVRERRTVTGWTRLLVGLPCLDILYTLQAGAEAQMLEPITSDWTPGRYRMTTPIEMPDGTRLKISTPPFEVRQ